MKTKSVLFFALLLTVVTLFSCKKDGGGDDGLSDDIKNFVPQSVIDSMRNWGMTINEGKTPPAINGIYVFSPNYCTFDNSGDYREGDTFDDYKYWFSNQDNDALTIKMTFKNLPYGTDTASGTGAFLSGSGTSFTAYVNVSGVSEGVSYSRIDFYSGTVTSTGITNFQTAFYLKSKGDDPTNKLVDVGSSRIFSDNDYVSDITNTYRVVPQSGESKTNGGMK